MALTGVAGYRHQLLPRRHKKTPGRINALAYFLMDGRVFTMLF